MDASAPPTTTPVNAFSQLDLDLPGDPRPRRIFRAHGSRKVTEKDLARALGAGRRRPKTIDNWINVNAPTRAIAERAGKNFLHKLGYKFDFIIELSWREYAESLRRSGFKIEGI